MNILFVLALFCFIVSMVAFNVYSFNKGKLIGMQMGRKSLPQAQSPVEIVCLCGHGPNFHIDNGKCDQTVQWDVYGVGKMDWTKQTKCRCKKYTGPEFLPTYVDRVELELQK